MTAPEPAAGTARPQPWTALAAGLVLILLMGVIAWRAVGDRGGADVDPPPEAATEARAQRAERALESLAAAWRDRDRAGFVEAAGGAPGAGSWAGRTYDALELLGVAQMSLTFLGERAQPSQASVPGAAQSFLGDVEVGWVIGDYRTAASTVTLSFGDSEDVASVLGLAGGGVAVAQGGALPLWLAGELVAGGPGSRCLGVDAPPTGVHCQRLVRVAERDLAAVVPARLRDDQWWVAVPRTGAQAAALLGRESALGRVAAVATTLDASGSRGAPAVVVLNPDVFGGLRPAAAQLVMSHEAVHAATGAAAVDLPLWVAEGFADYVALRAGRVPVERAASRLLGTVRRSGPPGRLPDERDFAASRNGLGQTYEAAWLVFRLLAERYGDEAVVAFYASVLDGAPVDRALDATTGLTPSELTSAWRRYLVRLAG